MDAYCPRAVQCAPSLLPVGIHTEAGVVARCVSDSAIAMLGHVMHGDR